MLALRLVASAFASAIALSACVAEGPPEPSGFLVAYQGRVVYLQWSEGDDGDVVGSLHMASANENDDDELVDSQTLAVTGQVVDQEISLAVDFGLGVRQTWNGVRRDSGLTLHVPQDDGTLQPMELTKSTVEAFNVEVERLRTSAQEARAAAAAAEEAAAAAEEAAQRAEALDAARGAASEALADMEEAVSAMDSTPKLAPLLGDVDDAVTKVQRAYDRAQDVGCAERGDAIQTVSDEHLAVFDAVSSVRDASTEIRSAADAVDDAATRYRTAVEDLLVAGDGQASVDPSVAAAEQGAAKARTKADAGVAAAEGHQAEAQRIMDEAYELEVC